MLWHEEGGRDSVVIPDTKLSHLSGNVVTHNHPQGWRYPANDRKHAGSSFSPDDVALMAHFDLVEMRAVSPGYTHMLRPSQDPASSYGASIAGSSYVNVLQQILPVWSTVTTIVQVRVDDPDDDFTEDDLRIIRPHLVMLELREQWGLEYEREEFP